MDAVIFLYQQLGNRTLLFYLYITAMKERSNINYYQIHSPNPSISIMHQSFVTWPPHPQEIVGTFDFLSGKSLLETQQSGGQIVGENTAHFPPVLYNFPLIFLPDTPALVPHWGEDATIETSILACYPSPCP